MFYKSDKKIFGSDIYVSDLLPPGVDVLLFPKEIALQDCIFYDCYGKVIKCISSPTSVLTGKQHKI